MLAIVLMTMSLLVTSTTYAAGSTSSKPAQAVSSQKSTSNNIKNNIFNLSDQQIKNAIAIGTQDYDRFVDFEDSQKLSIDEDKLGVWQPRVFLSTPYHTIAGISFVKSYKYDGLSFEEAKKFAKFYRSPDILEFEIEALGDSINFADVVRVELIQGDKVYKPLELSIDEEASNSKFWPNSPAYRNDVKAKFDIKKIDLSKEAKLVYMYSGKKMSVTYKVDFSKIK